MTGIEYSETREFRKDFKKLRKRFRTLEEDFEMVKRAVIKLYHIMAKDNQSVFQIPKLSTTDIHIYKIKKFACKALKGKGSRSGIRVIYAFHPKKVLVEFLEIYYKGDKADEDRNRIKSYLKKFAE